MDIINSNVYNFQDPATPVAEAIIDLHNYIIFYLIWVLVFVIFILFDIFVQSYEIYKERFFVWLGQITFCSFTIYSGADPAGTLYAYRSSFTPVISFILGCFAVVLIGPAAFHIIDPLLADVIGVKPSSVSTDSSSVFWVRPFNSKNAVSFSNEFNVESLVRPAQHNNRSSAVNEFRFQSLLQPLESNDILSFGANLNRLNGVAKPQISTLEFEDSILNFDAPILKSDVPHSKDVSTLVLDECDFSGFSENASLYGLKICPVDWEPAYSYPFHGFLFESRYIWSDYRAILNHYFIVNSGIRGEAYSPNLYFPEFSDTALGSYLDVYLVRMRPFIEFATQAFQDAENAIDESYPGIDVTTLKRNLVPVFRDGSYLQHQLLLRQELVNIITASQPIIQNRYGVESESLFALQALLEMSSNDLGEKIDALLENGRYSKLNIESTLNSNLADSIYEFLAINRQTGAKELDELEVLNAFRSFLDDFDLITYNSVIIPGKEVKIDFTEAHKALFQLSQISETVDDKLAETNSCLVLQSKV